MREVLALHWHCKHWTASAEYKGRAQTAKMGKLERDIHLQPVRRARPMKNKTRKLHSETLNVAM